MSGWLFYCMFVWILDDLRSETVNGSGFQSVLDCDFAMLVLSRLFSLSTIAYSI